MSRTMLSALALIGLTAAAFAQGQATPPVGPDFSKVVVKTTDLGHNTYLLEAPPGGNITVAIGGDGVIMVDGNFAPMHDRLRAAIAKLSPLPIKYLVNTHHHGDHTGGNAAFAKDGTIVVGHINERNMLAAGTIQNTTMAKVPAVAPEALPTETYKDKLILKVKGRTARLVHPAAGHTGGDTYVYFADANVLATGDTFQHGRYPNIDWVNGGSIDGVINADAAYIALANKGTKIVPGHGPLATKEDVKAFRAMLVEARKRMKKLVKEGKTENEVYDLKPFADFDGKYAANQQAAKSFIRVMYFNIKK